MTPEMHKEVMRLVREIQDHEKDIERAESLLRSAYSKDSEQTYADRIQRMHNTIVRKLDVIKLLKGE